MVLPENVLIDTSAFYVLASDTDIFQQTARNQYGGMLDGEVQLWTTSYALVETIALIQRRLGFHAVSTFIRGADEVVNIFWVDEEVHSQAWKRLTEHRGVGLSFVDWTIALVSDMMDATIFTFDRGFANQGFTVMPR